MSAVCNVVRNPSATRTFAEANSLELVQWWANQKRFWVWFCTFPLGFACLPMGSVQGLPLSPTYPNTQTSLAELLPVNLWLLEETSVKTDARTDNLCFTMIGITVMFPRWVRITNQSHYFENLFSQKKGLKIEQMCKYVLKHTWSDTSSPWCWTMHLGD